LFQENVKQEDKMVLGPEGQFEVKNEVSSEEDDGSFIDDMSDYSDMEEDDDSDEAESPVKKEEPSFETGEFDSSPFDPSKFLKLEVKTSFEIGTKLELSKKKLKEKKFTDVEQCNLCGKESRNKEALQCHVRRYHRVQTGNKRFSCDYCDFRSHRKDHIGSHMRRLHEGLSIGCPSCGQKFNMKCDLKNHLKSIHDVVDDTLECKCTQDTATPIQVKRAKEEKLHCELCGITFCNSANLRVHVRNIHEGQKYLCSLCGVSYNQSSTLSAQMKRTHQGSVTPCPSCEDVFNSKSAMKLHFMEKHEEFSEQCNICGKESRNKDALACHIRRYHNVQPGDKPFSCDHCDFRTHRKDFIGIHMKRFHEGICISCHSCGKKFMMKCSLKKHLKSKHDMVDDTLECNCTIDPLSPRRYGNGNGDKFKCREPNCDKEYVTNQALLNHTQAVHEGVRWYCDQCSESFKRQGALASHIEDVHDMKRFQCDQCEKGNYTRKGLSEHRRAIHEGLNHPCEQCGATFTTAGSMRTHVKNVHEGHKYICSLCGVSYNQSQPLSLHMRSIHPGFKKTNQINNE
jgi:KRAB domain-containing zinc finger protein